MNKEEYQKQMLRKMNIILSLLIDIKCGTQEKKMTNREKIILLNNAGLDYKEIAQIIGKKEGYVAVELSTIKRKKEKVKKLFRGEE